MMPAGEGARATKIGQYKIKALPAEGRSS